MSGTLLGSKCSICEKTKIGGLFGKKKYNAGEKKICWNCAIESEEFIKSISEIDEMIAFFNSSKNEHLLEHGIKKLDDFYNHSKDNLIGFITSSKIAEVINPLFWVALIKANSPMSLSYDHYNISGSTISRMEHTVMLRKIISRISDNESLLQILLFIHFDNAIEKYDRGRGLISATVNEKALLNKIHNENMEFLTPLIDRLDMDRKRILRKNAVSDLIRSQS